MVVQFGLAIIPLAGFCAACGFTSATTRGTSGSLRYAEELSTTVAPAAANTGAHCLEVEPPAENRAISTSATDSSVISVRSSTRILSRRNLSSVRAERGDAEQRTVVERK